MATKFWPKYAKKSQNWHNFSCLQHIHAEFSFGVGFLPLGNSSVTLPYGVHKGQRGVTMATNFGTNIAINAYNAFLREITRMQLFITGGFRGLPIQRRHF